MDRHRRRRSRTRRRRRPAAAAPRTALDRSVHVQAVIGRPGEADIAGAGPEDHGMVAGGRGMGDPAGAHERIEGCGLPVAGGIADPDRGRPPGAHSPVALAEGQDAVAPGDRSPDRCARSRGAARSTRSPRHRSMPRRSPGPPRGPPLRHGDDRVRKRDDVGDRAGHRRRRAGRPAARPGPALGRSGRRWPAARRSARPTATGVGAADEPPGSRVGGRSRLGVAHSPRGQTDEDERRGIRRGGAGRGGGTCPWDAARPGRDERRNATEALSAVASAGPRRSRARRSGRSGR